MVVGPTPAAAADANDLVTVRNGYTFASMDGSANSFACAQRYRSFDPASTRVSECGLRNGGGRPERAALDRVRAAIC